MGRAPGVASSLSTVALDVTLHRGLTANPLPLTSHDPHRAASVADVGQVMPSGEVCGVRGARKELKLAGAAGRLLRPRRAHQGHRFGGEYVYRVLHGDMDADIAVAAGEGALRVAERLVIAPGQRDSRRIPQAVEALSVSLE